MRSPRVFLALLLVAAAGCTGSDDDPDADTSLQQARGRLAVLAQATANGAYDAQYRFLQLPSNTTGVIRLRQSPPQYRIDIISKDGASFFALTSGVVSCASRGVKKTCYRVAKPGEEVPGLFDPGVQRLFRDAVEDLAANPGNYLVTPVDAPPTATPTGSPTATPTAAPTGSLPIPKGECFRVERADTSPDPNDEIGFENGTYCFAEQGVATDIWVASGNLTLVKLLGPPTKGAFEPPAKVQTLPSLTPTPTPSKKK